MSASTNETPALTVCTAQGEDTSGVWGARCEVLNGRVHEHLWRGYRNRYPLNIRRDLDEAEAYHATCIALIHNERLRQALVQRDQAPAPAPSTRRAG